MLHRKIVKHVPVRGLVAYPNIQTSALSDGDAGIANAVDHPGGTSHHCSALGIAANVFELLIQQDPVQIGFGLVGRVRIVVADKKQFKAS